MTIMREGKSIELNPTEIIKAWEEHERSIIRYEVESLLNEFGYQFDNYAEQGSEYASADEFRNDFIDYCVDSCFEKMTDDEFSAFTNKINDTVESMAEDFELKQEF